MKKLLLILALFIGAYSSYAQTIPPMEQKAPTIDIVRDAIAKMKYDDGIEAIKRNDFKTALKAFKNADKIYPGYYPTYYAIGILYWEGKGVKQSRKKAVKWFKKAATYNYLPAVEALKILDVN